MLEDARGTPARFQLLIQTGRPKLERAASVIQDQLRKIGLRVDVVALDGLTVIQHILSGQYEAVYFAPQPTDTDPATTPDFWFSSGSSHLWNPSQPTPATSWERRIDELMTQQGASFDEQERKRLFDEVQRIFVEHLPIVYFAVPHVYVATSARLTSTHPAAYFIPILWSADDLATSRRKIQCAGLIRSPPKE